ncbi:LEAF RUST 10 DISEASE-RESISTANCEUS RECEPTOR-LIKE PROTEIN KINASE-like 1.2 isoform X1 [Medicago truncatula]|uniref:Tyrosine kinase family protein n=2 Tax=Medicago truncatula TaxID=3880 RepID=A0A072UD27_MEDTR|nr:LEAF RUST 10 DISEASE-RESISTANCE LOCUS RECEPTOR-LIKE PROTEIN KINASE-like 1.2 isoform X1 [Medicago truncatula]KEH26978.1 tyrosine kinase family protein [Medicago truncatula]
MPIFSFLCHCFSPDGNGKKNNPSLTRGFEEKCSNFGAVSSEKAINNDQMVSVDSKVTSKCDESVPVNVISELPSSHGAEALMIDSEVQNNQCNITESEIFKYSELEEATSNFDNSRILGKGGYGTVYSGTLKDGRLVAIKRLHKDKFKMLRLHDNKLEEETLRKFINEVSMLTRMRHANLVQLYGCTSPQTRELLLVQEYVPNGTVSCRLHKHTFPWPARLNVALQTASALAYLHASNVIHRDVKTSNILLDKSLNAKVADFGLSRLVPNGATHVTTDPAGTPGYIDPEYYEHCHLSDKSDVYSFGVILVELISSLPAFSEDEKLSFLSDFAMDKILKGQLEKLVDPTLGFQSDNWVSQTVGAVAELAFACLQPQRDMRPSMSEVFNTLESIKSGSSQKALKWGSNNCYNATKVHIVSRLPDDYFEKK